MRKKNISLGLMLVLSVAMLPVSAEHPAIIDISKTKNTLPEVKNFFSVAAGGPIKVIITLGEKEGVRFEGDADAISTLITEVKGSALIIRPQMSWTSWAHKYKGKEVIAHVNAKNIASLTMSGDGSITVKGTLNQSALTTTLSGSGFITANIDVSDFTAVLSGSGKLNITGDAEKANITISGSGNVSKKDGLNVAALSTRISGSGAVYVHTDGEINALILGSGSVYYTGNADVNQKTLGSGRVKEL